MGKGKKNNKGKTNTSKKGKEKNRLSVFAHQHIIDVHSFLG